MARNIADLHQIVLDIFRKERGGMLTSAQIDEFLDLGSKDLFLEYKEEYVKTGQLPVALSPFKKRISFTLASSPNGLVTIPNDYEFFLNGYTVTFDNIRGRQENKITPVNEDEKVIATNSQLRPVTTKSAVMVQGSGYFVLYPQQPVGGEINYVSTPVTPLYAYTQAGRVITYDPANSIQLQWRDIYLNKVIAYALPYMSINLNEAQVQQFAQQREMVVAT